MLSTFDPPLARALLSQTQLLTRLRLFLAAVSSNAVHPLHTIDTICDRARVPKHCATSSLQLRVSPGLWEFWFAPTVHLRPTCLSLQGQGLQIQPALLSALLVRPLLVTSNWVPARFSFSTTVLKVWLPRRTFHCWEPRQVLSRCFWQSNIGPSWITHRNMNPSWTSATRLIVSCPTHDRLLCSFLLLCRNSSVSLDLRKPSPWPFFEWAHMNWRITVNHGQLAQLMTHCFLPSWPSLGLGAIPSFAEGAFRVRRVWCSFLQLILAFSFLFAFALAFVFAFALPFASISVLALAFAFAIVLPFSLHILLSASYSCNLVALNLAHLHHSESCGLCASIAALNVSQNVSKLCGSYCRTRHSHSSKAWPLLSVRRHCSNCISIARYRALFTGSHSSRNRFEISSPFTESLSLVIIWIARFFVCIINERKPLYSFLSSIVHSKQGQFSQRIRFHICEFRTELFINRKRLPLVSSPEVNWFSSLFLGILGTGVRAAPASSITSCWYISWSCWFSTTEQSPPSNNSDAVAPEYPKLPGSVNATTSSATMRGRVTTWDVFSWAVAERASTLKIMVSRRCTCPSNKKNREGQTTIHKLKTR